MNYSAFKLKLRPYGVTLDDAAVQKTLGKLIEAADAEKFEWLPDYMWSGLGEIARAIRQTPSMFMLLDGEKMEGSFAVANRELHGVQDQLKSMQMTWLQGMLEAATVPAVTTPA